MLATLPAPVRDRVAEAFADVFSTLFVAALPVAVLGRAAAVLLRPVPLAGRGPDG
ncbi:hypothetical protein [Actinomadura mexicana]|uniref:Uncharacterized protein n=1 Tax=Actinomadura mexicana TaxID=134959 RepID=A0A238ZMU8_9ACTN|nr:hypothetical protein [Actinomadura mexicana]SNR84492.1 hypothetical protein SAMN06265355_107357 [Actinomadura mexicana]